MDHAKIKVLVGEVEWLTESRGHCCCPGERLHTKPTKATDCTIVVKPEQNYEKILPPGVYCFHDSCAEDCQRASQALRQLLRGGSTQMNMCKIGSKAPKTDPCELIRRFVKNGSVTVDMVISSSPLTIPANPLEQTLLTLQRIYEPDDTVNIVLGNAAGELVHGGVGQSAKNWISGWKANPPRWLPGGAWIRLNPTDGGITDENITRWRFCLLECDYAPIEVQLALFTQLRLPIALIVLSGGKSAHAWVEVAADDLKHYEEQVGRIFQLLKPFGIDQKNKNASRLGRLPGAIRTIGAQGDGVQRLLYLNPNPTPDPIL